MSYIGKNIKKIRTVKNLSQAAFAQLFNLARPSVGAYEEGRSEPKIETLLQIAQYFGISIDLLLTKELTINELYGFDIFKKALNKEDALKNVAGSKTEQNQLIPLVTSKTAETYLRNLKETSFIAGLPTIYIPLEKDSEYRAFEVTYTSGQHPTVKQGDILVCTSLQKGAKQLQEGQLYVFITSEAIYTETIRTTDQEKKLISFFERKGAAVPELHQEQLLELWEPVAIINYTPLPEPQPGDRITLLEQKLQELSNRLDRLEK